MPTPVCATCGAVFEADARFCGSCGEPLIVVPTTTEVELPVPGLPPAPTLAAAAPPVAAAAPAAATARPSASKSATDNILGRTLNGRYLVQRKIGHGGFGAVYQGKQIATGREVALKVLHPQNVTDATVVARFRREAEACSQLRNPHTVTIYDFDETEDGTLYLAMELVRGRSLQQLQRKEGVISPERVMEILAQVSDALGEAHGKGIVHRDMKPENVMVETREDFDFAKVLDFGIAKIVSGDGAKGPALTAFGQTVGTLEFMSPEQLRGKPLDGRSDIYALGIMCYEMLTGELPFANAKNPSEVIRFHLETPPPPPSRLRPHLKIPAVVDDLVLKMVQKDPDQRHVDAEELRNHIDEALAALRRPRPKVPPVVLMLMAGGLAILATTAAVVAMR